MKQLLEFALIVNANTRNERRFQDTSAAVPITNATNATPIVVTAANHGLRTGDQIFIYSVGGNLAANNTAGNPAWTVTVTDANTFSLNNSIGNGAYTAATGNLVNAMIGTVDGDRYSRQRLLDMYNKARMTFVHAINITLPKREKSKAIAAAIVRATTFQFTSQVATLPAGFIEELWLRDVAGVDIPIVQAADLPQLSGYDSATNRFVFREDSSLKCVPGSTSIVDASTYVLAYYGIADFVIFNDIVGGVVNESINDDWLPKLMEIAVAIASEQSYADVLALAVALVKARVPDAA